MKLDCHNCGAPRIYTKYVDRFHCEHCGTLHEPTARELHSVRLLDAPSDHDCPLGHGALHHAELDRWRGQACPRCAGLFLDELVFWRVLQFRRVNHEGKRRPPRSIRPEELARELTCPGCGKRMATHPYYGPGNFVIDHCDACSAVWLDRGELQTGSEAEWVD